MGGGPPYTILSREEPWDCGSSWVWAEPSETNPPRSSQSLRSAWRVSSCVRLVPSTIPELWGLYAVSNFHLMFKVLLTCYTKSATEAGPWSDPMLVGNPNLGTISLSRHQATSDAFSPGRKSFYPSWECTYCDQQVMVVLVRFHFSEIHFQVFKGQCAFWLNPWRFLFVPRDSTGLWAGSAVLRWVWACTLRVYKVFRKTGRGPWLRWDSALGPPV